VRNIRLIIWSVAAVAALTAMSGFAPPAQKAAAQTRYGHRVNWGDIAVPGQLCQVDGQIRLHNGIARVSHSGLGPLFVQEIPAITYGDLERGFPVAAFQILCSNQGGTAAGKLADGIFVFASAGQPRFLGLLTPQYRPKQLARAYIPTMSVAHIDTQGHIATTEYFYTPANADCCPSGRASTIWKWTGRIFIPGRTTITSS
jgi:hypothetical protein